MPREISAVTSQLAKMLGEQTTSRNSLRELAEAGIATPGKYMPHELTVVGMTAKVAWMAGFSEAMSVVLAHIDSAMPRPRSTPPANRR